MTDIINLEEPDGILWAFKNDMITVEQGEAALTEWRDREVAVELEKLKSEASVNNLLTEDGFWYLEHRLQALKASKGDKGAE